MAYFQVTINDAVYKAEKGYIVKAKTLKEVYGIMWNYLPDYEGDFKVRMIKSLLVEPKVSCEKCSGGYICRMYACTSYSKDHLFEGELRLRVDASSEEEARRHVIDLIKKDIPIKAPVGTRDVDKKVIGFIR